MKTNAIKELYNTIIAKESSEDKFSKVMEIVKNYKGNLLKDTIEEKEIEVLKYLVFHNGYFDMIMDNSLFYYACKDHKAFLYLLTQELEFINTLGTDVVDGFDPFLVHILKNADLEVFRCIVNKPDIFGILDISAALNTLYKNENVFELSIKNTEVFRYLLDNSIALKINIDTSIYQEKSNTEQGEQEAEEGLEKQENLIIENKQEIDEDLDEDQEDLESQEKTLEDIKQENPKQEFVIEDQENLIIENKQEAEQDLEEQENLEIEEKQEKQDNLVIEKNLIIENKQEVIKEEDLEEDIEEQENLVIEENKEDLKSRKDSIISISLGMSQITLNEKIVFSNNSYYMVDKESGSYIMENSGNIKPAKSNFSKLKKIPSIDIGLVDEFEVVDIVGEDSFAEND